MEHDSCCRSRRTAVMGSWREDADRRSEFLRHERYERARDCGGSAGGGEGGAFGGSWAAAAGAFGEDAGSASGTGGALRKASDRASGARLAGCRVFGEYGPLAVCKAAEHSGGVGG